MTTNRVTLAFAVLVLAASAFAQQPAASVGLVADERWSSGLPLGGIGCGDIEVLTDGGFGAATINNNWDRPTGFLRGALMAVYAGQAGEAGQACILRLGSGDEFKNVANVHHVLFHGLWPEARLKFSDDRLPVNVAVRAWSSLVPGNADDSALPAAVFDFTVSRRTGPAARVAPQGDLDVSLLFSWPNLLGFGGGRKDSWEDYNGDKQSQFRQGRLIGLRFTTTQHYSDRQENTVGDYFLAADISPLDEPSVDRSVETLPAWDCSEPTPSWWASFSKNGTMPGPPPEWGAVPWRPAGAVVVHLRIPAAVKQVSQRFVLAWYTPHLITDHQASVPLATLSENPSGANLAIDGNPNTRWTMNRHMYPGERFELDLPHPVTASGFTIDLNKSLHDWPRGLRVYASPDGHDFHVIADLSEAQVMAAAHSGLIHVNFPSTTFRVLRLEQEGRTDYWWWSIYELVLLDANGKPISLQGAHATAFYRDLGVRDVREDVGHWYQRRFASAVEVASYVAANADRLWSATDQWRRPVLSSSLPMWLKVKLLNDAYTMFSNTVLTRDGRFTVFESPVDMNGALGTMDQRMAAHAFYLEMFPDLDQSELRLYAHCQQEDGRITHFCGNIREAIGDPNVGYGITDWPDLSCSFIMQVYKNALWTGDRQFLVDLYPNIQRALVWLAAADHDGDLIPEGGSTFDYEQVPRGAFIYTASCYLGALLAGEHAAEIVGDQASADAYRARFQAVQASVMRNLWEGDHFVKWSRPPLPTDPPGSAGEFIPNTFVASLAGDWLARLSGLPNTLPPGIAGKECASLIARHMKPFWPIPPMEVTPDGFLATSTCYFLQEEPYLGCELIYRGFVDEGLDVFRRAFLATWIINRDPWHQPLNYSAPSGREGGLRSYMTCPASWHILPALTGASDDLFDGTLYLSPRLPSGMAELHVPIFMAEWWGQVDWVPGKSLVLTITKTFKPGLTFTRVAADGNSKPIKLATPFVLTPGAKLDLTPFLAQLHPVRQG